MGFKFNPLTAELEFGPGLADQLRNTDGATMTLATDSSPFGQGIVHIPPGVEIDTNYIAAHNLSFYAGANSDGLGAYAPSFALAESGQIIITTNNPATSGNNTYQIVAEDGFYLSKDGSLPALIKTDLLTAGHTYQFPDIDGTFVTSDATGMVGINTLLPSEKLTVNGNYLLRDADTPTKAYRFRTSGSDLDLDGAGANLYVSMYQNADFTGTQRFYLGFNASSHYADAFGNWIFHNDIFGPAYFSIRDDNGEVVVNDDASNLDFRVENQSLTHMIYVAGASATKNIALLAGAAPNWQSMDGGIFIGNGTTIPAGDPAGGGFLYVDSGALKYRGSSGTVTTVAAA